MVFYISYRLGKWNLSLSIRSMPLTISAVPHMEALLHLWSSLLPFSGPLPGSPFLQGIYEQAEHRSQHRSLQDFTGNLPPFTPSLCFLSFNYWHSHAGISPPVSQLLHLLKSLWQGLHQNLIKIHTDNINQTSLPMCLLIPSEIYRPRGLQKPWEKPYGLFLSRSYLPKHLLMLSLIRVPANLLMLQVCNCPIPLESF